MPTIVCWILVLAGSQPAVDGGSGPLEVAADLLTRGQAFLQAEKYQQALNDFSAVLQKQPNHAEANLGRARALIGLGDGRKAAGPARLAAELDPEDVAAWEVLGDAYAHDSHQDFPRAVEAYRKALKRDPARLETSMKLARALSFMKEVDQAIAVLEAARERHPQELGLLVKLAESYYAVRKLEQAETLIRQAQELEPGNPEVRRVLGQIEGRRAYNFWVPIIAIVAFPLVYVFVRWMKKGRVPKVDA